MSTDDSSESIQNSQQKQEQEQPAAEPADDLMALNEGAETINEDSGLEQQDESDFDPGDYQGFPIENWQRYFGSINDKRQARAASLSTYTKYKVYFNAAGNASTYPDFKILELTYFPITKKIWERRRQALGELEDLQNVVNVQNTRLAEMQESLRLRIFNRNKPRGMVTNRNDPNKAMIEEIQTNTRALEEFQMDIAQKLSEKRQATDADAFEMYFHRNRDIYDQIRNEDLDDILRACDWKQMHGPANLRRSKASSSPSPSAGTA